VRRLLADQGDEELSIVWQEGQFAVFGSMEDDGDGRRGAGTLRPPLHWERVADDAVHLEPGEREGEEGDDR
jgi:hypothetical protein